MLRNRRIQSAKWFSYVKYQISDGYVNQDSQRWLLTHPLSFSPLPPLCSKNFQNVMLSLDFIEIWSYYCCSDFTWNQILVNSYGPKMLFLPIWKVLKSNFSKFEQFSSPKFTKAFTSRFESFWSIVLYDTTLTFFARTPI